MKNSDEKLHSGFRKNTKHVLGILEVKTCIKDTFEFYKIAKGWNGTQKKLRSTTICWSPPRVKITVKELVVEISWEIHPVFHGNPRFLHFQRL